MSNLQTQSNTVAYPQRNLTSTRPPNEEAERVFFYEQKINTNTEDLTNLIRPHRVSNKVVHFHSKEEAKPPRQLSWRELLFLALLLGAALTQRRSLIPPS